MRRAVERSRCSTGRHLSWRSLGQIKTGAENRGHCSGSGFVGFRCANFSDSTLHYLVPLTSNTVTAAQSSLLPLAVNEVRHKPRLSYVDGSGSKQVSLSGKSVVGSAEGSEVRVHDSTVSRLHAELDVRGDGVWIKDLASRNGSFVNGVLVREGRLPDRADIQLGNTRLLLEYGDESEAVELWPSERFGRLVGRGSTMRALFRRIARVAPTDSTVLIQGETGTGKELIARAIHDNSPRSEEPYVVMDCASVAETLLESELFGHARGAFTGAAISREGAAEAAHRGTLFLDEVGELPLAMQPKLLRLLESRMVRRVGEVKERPVDLRVIAATHRDLREMVNAGTFREDLYFRLAVLPLYVAPLRERREDIPALVRHFLPSEDFDVVSKETMAQLAMRPWHGNVRELRNFVERLLALGAEEALDMEQVERGNSLTVDLDTKYKVLRERWLNRLEREYISGLLERCERNLSEVANQAGLDRSYVHRLVRKHGL